MKIKEILREYNEARLLNDFGNKIITRAKEDNTAPKYKEPKQYIEALAKLDPTPKVITLAKSKKYRK